MVWNLVTERDNFTFALQLVCIQNFIVTRLYTQLSLHSVTYFFFETHYRAEASECLNILKANCTTLSCWIYAVRMLLL